MIHGDWSTFGFTNLVDLVKRINQIMMDEGFTFPTMDFVAKDVDLNSIPLHDQLQKLDSRILQDDLQPMQHSTLHLSEMKKGLIEVYPFNYI